MTRNWNQQARVQHCTWHHYFAPVLWVIASFPGSTPGNLFSWKRGDQQETIQGKTEPIYLPFQIPLPTPLFFSLVKWTFASIPSANLAWLPVCFSCHLYSLILIAEHRPWIYSFVISSSSNSEKHYKDPPNIYGLCSDIVLICKCDSSSWNQ